MNKEIECVNEDENWDGIVAELNPYHEGDDKESKNDVNNDIEPINLKDVLPSSITRYKLWLMNLVIKH